MTGPNPTVSADKRSYARASVSSDSMAREIVGRFGSRWPALRFALVANQYDPNGADRGRLGRVPHGQF